MAVIRHKWHYLRGVRAFKQTSNAWRAYLALDQDDPPTKDNPLDILGLVERFCGHDCSDDRDRVFALYAMAHNIQPTSKRSVSETANIVYMDIDYTISISATYRDFAIACLRNARTLQILQYAMASPHDSKTGDWPSWVPDWRVARVGSNHRTHSATYDDRDKDLRFTDEISGKRIGLCINTYPRLQESLITTVIRNAPEFLDSVRQLYMFIQSHLRQLHPDLSGIR